MQRIFITTLIAVMLLATAGTVAAQQKSDTMRLSLKDAQDYAMKNSNAAKNVLLDASSLKWRTKEILSQGMPHIDGAVKYANNYILPTTLLPYSAFSGIGSSVNPYISTLNQDLPNLHIPTLNFPDNGYIATKFGTTNNADVTFSASQLIADGRYFIGLRANKAFISIAQEQIKMTEIQVRNSVATAYYAALVAEEGRRIIDINLKSIKQLNYETSELFKAGFAEELDTDRISLTLSNLQAKMNEAQVRAELTKTALAQAMGLDLETPIQLTDSLEGLMVSNTALTEVDFDYKSREEYKLLVLSHSLKSYDAQQTRAGYLPSLVLSAMFDINAQRESFSFFDTKQPWYNYGYVGVQLNVPIFDGLKNQAVYQQKKMDKLKTENDMENFKLQAGLQVKAAKSNYRIAVSDYETQKRNIALAQKIFDMVTTKSKAGLATSFELSQAEASLNETQGNYVTAIYNLLVNKTELDKALGKY